MPDFTIQAKPGPASCPLCSETLAEGGPTQACPGCEVSYHQACFSELGGCGTLGCERAKGRAASRPRLLPRRSSQPSSVILATLVLLGLGLLLVAFKSGDKASFDETSANFLEAGKDRSLGSAPAPAPELIQEEEVRAEVERESSNFVFEVVALAQKREFTQNPEHFRQNPELQERRDQRKRGALLSYEKLLEIAATNPTEIRKDLRQRVLRLVAKENHQGAERILEEIYALEPLSAAPQESSLDDLAEKHLRQAAELIAVGKGSDDPEVRRHVNAATAYRAVARSGLSKDERRELRQAAELVAAGRDRNDPEVQRHLNAAEAYQASARSDLSPEQRRELRQAAALLAAGWDRNDPGVLKHVEAAAAYGRAAEQAAKSE